MNLQARRLLTSTPLEQAIFSARLIVTTNPNPYHKLIPTREHALTLTSSSTQSRCQASMLAQQGRPHVAHVTGLMRAAASDRLCQFGVLHFAWVTRLRLCCLCVFFLFFFFLL